MKGWSRSALVKFASPDVVIPKPQRRGRAQEDDCAPAAAHLRAEQKKSLQRKFAGRWSLLLRERYGLHAPNVLQLDPEFQFHPSTEWRIDFALPGLKVMVEIDGGTWSDGRTAHNWGPGISNDYIKQNAATRAGWHPFRLSADLIDEPNIQPILEYATQLMASAKPFVVPLNSISEAVYLGQWGDNDMPTRHYYALSDSVVLASWVDLPPTEAWSESEQEVICAAGYGYAPAPLRGRMAIGRRVFVSIIE